jgi:hypothetical protein
MKPITIEMNPPPPCAAHAPSHSPDESHLLLKAQSLLWRINTYSPEADRMAAEQVVSMMEENGEWVDHLEQFPEEEEGG